MPSRLSTIAPDLVAWLEHQSRERLRGAAANAAHLAVERTRLTDPRLDAALTVLRNGQFGRTAEQSGVQQLVDELDADAWDLQEKAEVGTVPYQAYSAAFMRARAAASVGFALGSDALSAALEAVYEAHAATDDLDAVQAAASAEAEQ
jgi:hypothetical protein